MDDTPIKGNVRNLRPFVKGDTRAVEAGRKSAEVRRAKRDLIPVENADLARTLDSLRTTFQREVIGESAAAVAGQILARIGSGAIPIRNGDEAAALLRTLVDITRLEAGEHTSAALTGSVDAVGRVIELQRRAREVIAGSGGRELSAAATAVVDATSHEVGGGAVEVGATPPS